MIESSKAKEYLYFKIKLESAQKENNEKETNFLFDQLENVWNEMTDKEREQAKKQSER